MRRPIPTPPRWGLGDDPHLTSAVRVMQENNHVTSLLSHELNTPLSVVMASLETLADGGLNLEQTHEVHRLIGSNIDRLRKNIGRIILFMQLEWESHNGIAPPYIRPGLDFFELLAVSLSMVQESLDKKGVTTKLQLEGETPVMTCCQDRLELCLYEILDNAVKFTPPGGNLTLHSHCRPPWVHLDIEQAPVAIDPEYLRLFYLPFWQQEALNTRRIDGMGLGIPLIRRLIVSLGGQFTISAADQRIDLAISLPVDAGDPSCS